MTSKTCFHCQTEKLIAAFALSNASKSPDKHSIICLDRRDILSPQQRAALEIKWWRHNRQFKHKPAEK